MVAVVKLPTEAGVFRRRGGRSAAGGGRFCAVQGAARSLAIRLGLVGPTSRHQLAPRTTRPDQTQTGRRPAHLRAPASGAVGGPASSVYRPERKLTATRCSGPVRRDSAPLLPHVYRELQLAAAPDALGRQYSGAAGRPPPPLMRGSIVTLSCRGKLNLLSLPCNAM